MHVFRKKLDFWLGLPREDKVLDYSLVLGSFKLKVSLPDVHGAWGDFKKLTQGDIQAPTVSLVLSFDQWNMSLMFAIFSGNPTQVIHINHVAYFKKNNTRFKTCCSYRCDRRISNRRICHSNRRKLDARYAVDVFHWRWHYMALAIQSIWDQQRAMIHSNFLHGFLSGQVVSDTHFLHCTLLRTGLFLDSLSINNCIVYVCILLIRKECTTLYD